MANFLILIGMASSILWAVYLNEIQEINAADEAEVESIYQEYKKSASSCTYLR